MSTTKTTWENVFAPVMAQGREIREGQAVLGQAILDAINNKTNLIAEASTGTGKSFAALIPSIDAIRAAKKEKKSYRVAVSTETLALQTQLVNKDLPFLSKLYPGFTYRKLMGRSNYLCLEVASQNTVGNLQLHKIVEKLKMRKDSIGDGEQGDIERVLGREIDKSTWDMLSSSSTFCPDNQCKTEDCFSTKARAKALTADLVVVNHAILATDLEMRLNNADGPGADGMLGKLNCLIVDEGHQLETVLSSQWTTEITERDLTTQIASIMTGLDLAKAAVSNSTLAIEADRDMDKLIDVLDNIKRFFSLLEESNGGSWENASLALSLKYPMGMPARPILLAMDEFETDNPVRLAQAEATLTKVVDYFMKAVPVAVENKIKGVRKINKGFRAARDLLVSTQIMAQAITTDDGIIQHYGTYGAIVDGWVRRDQTQGMTLRLVPLDVSAKARGIWATVDTSILLSATLTDLTEGNFRYVKSSLGFPECKDVKVATPFDLATQQLIYITPANRERIALDGAQFSYDEMRDLMVASRGRALNLFTSRKEMEGASLQLLQDRNMGKFNYDILIQEKDVNKTKLMEQFKTNIDSVLLATKSFFVGIDVPGESLSLVAMAKWTNPRYDAECRQKVKHWRQKGFPNWYARQALTDFQQAAGRLIRGSGCKGVIALLDYRVNDKDSNVYKTARIGVDALGSPVTQDIEVVRQFLSS